MHDSKNREPTLGSRRRRCLPPRRPRQPPHAPPRPPYNVARRRCPPYRAPPRVRPPPRPPYNVAPVIEPPRHRQRQPPRRRRTSATPPRLRPPNPRVNRSAITLHTVARWPPARTRSATPCWPAPSATRPTHTGSQQQSSVPVAGRSSSRATPQSRPEKTGARRPPQPASAWPTRPTASAPIAYSGRALARTRSARIGRQTVCHVALPDKPGDATGRLT
jgi:hypothetical protein